MPDPASDALGRGLERLAAAIETNNERLAAVEARLASVEARMAEVAEAMAGSGEESPLHDIFQRIEHALNEVLDRLPPKPNGGGRA